MNSNRLIPILTATLSAMLLGGCSKGGDLSKSTQVLARVGDKEITTTYFDRQIGNLPESVQRLSTSGEGKKAILEALVNRELLYAAALEKKLDKTAEMQKKLDDLRKELIVNSYLQNSVMGKLSVNDSEVVNHYNANPTEFRNREEVRISQIVVPDEKTADDILQKLTIRRDFGELAKAHSVDKATAEKNGDVGWFSRAKLPESVRDSVFRMKVGEVSKPFRLADGYEIYRVTDRRTLSYTFEQVKDAIKVQLFNKKYQQELKALVDGLKKTTTVQINEALLR